ncbi:cyclic nucleotide-binding domain-containing protein [Acidithiobacillus ferrianus]|uniref:Cyclic nucleotide-binding domain-containing protein n=2 Tax=Acidithiobacillus ferrianus TaxID=2678518 RepID=A0ACD5H5Q9_9PROT|nr:cyclic nucleotide-binding domain-containing protein [Acidithiobacillus ferrianus]
MRPAASIDEVGAFRHLSEMSRSLLAHGLRYVRFPKKTPVLKKGQRVSGTYVVVSGNLRVFTLSPDGNEATLYLINPGETCVLVLNCIFNDLLYPAWVEAGPATQVAVIPGAIYRTLFESESAIRDMTVQAFSTLVFRLMAELEEIHSYKLEQRLTHLLLLYTSAAMKIFNNSLSILQLMSICAQILIRNPISHHVVK